MKKVLLSFIALLILSAGVYAQVPEAFNYQAVARDAGGNALLNQTIAIKINILEGSQFGQVEYSETHSVTTNQFGLFSLQVGRGVPVTGTFAGVGWTDADQWLQVEMDPNGGTNFFLMGTSELLSVPYALFAERVASVALALGDLTDVNTMGVQVGQTIKWNGTEWVPANDENTTYQAGPGLNLNGTTFEHVPHTGDAVGVVNLTVQGLQGIPVSAATPLPGEVLRYNSTLGRWEPGLDSTGQFLYAGNGIRIVNDTIHNVMWYENGQNAFRDQGSVIIGDTTPHPSAIFELSSTEQGFLPPRMSTPQRDNIASPAVGLTIFNISDSTLQYYNGDCWLTTFQESCDDCLFDFTITDTAGIITRTTTDTTGTDIILNQTSGTPQSISLFLVQNLPQGATAQLNRYSVFGSGTARLTVHSDVFATPGVYPIAIQAVCGSRVKIQVFEVTIDSCFEVSILTSIDNYDVQSINGLPGPGTPICVVVDVLPGINIGSSSPSAPAMTTGNLDAQSQVGIRNKGTIYGMGGDGGVGGNFTNFGDPGEDGGNALNLTVRTQVDNSQGYIYGGGGGGGSVALSIANIPILGNLSIGAGAGGGAGGGLGGNSAVPFLYAAGNNGTGLQPGVGGNGGVLNLPVTIPLQAATVTVTPNAVGGNGGDYGLAGGTGVVFVNIDVAVPLIGSIFNQNFPNPPPTNLPAAGEAGMAIKRNGNSLIGIIDGNYQTLFIKGLVGP